MTETSPPSQPQGQEGFIPITRQYPDGHTESFSVPPDVFARMYGPLQPFTVVPRAIPTQSAPIPVAHIEPTPTPIAEPQPAPPEPATTQQPATDPYVNLAASPATTPSHSVPPAEWLSARLHPTQPKDRIFTFNRAALRERFRRNTLEEVAIQERKSRRNSIYGVVAGAALVGTFWGGSTLVNSQITAANPQRTIATEQCIDAVPAGSVITARDFSLDGGNKISDGPNTVTIIVFTQEGKFCAGNQTAHIQQTGTTDTYTLDQIASNYVDQYRDAGFPIAIIETH